MYVMRLQYAIRTGEKLEPANELETLNRLYIHFISHRP